MTQTLKQKVQQILNESERDIISNFFQSEMQDEASKWDDEDHTVFREALKEDNVKFEHMDNHGGEGEGESFWSVYKFTDGTDEVFVQFDGYYYSYDGSTFDSWFFVKPQQVTVTQYFKDN